MSGSDVAIVGGGMLGMTLALRLQGEGRQVSIIEAASTPGGLVQSQTIGGYSWDRFYHVILLSDHNLRGLLEELGLSHLLRWGVTRTGFYTDGELYSMSSPLEFLRFPPLSLLDKARLGATIYRAAHTADPRPLEHQLATDWLRRLSGERAFARIWLPLLRSKLGENYRIASASFIWAIIARMYAARRSGLRREMFGYVEGGYGTVLRAYQRLLEARGVEFLLGRPVARVSDHGAEVEIRLADGDQRSFAKTVLTVPCGQVRRLCPDLAPSEYDRLGTVVYQGIVCASLLLRQPLSPFYITNITDPSVPYTAVIEMTALVDRGGFGGNSLVYLPRYLTQTDEFWQRSDEEIRELFVGALERAYPHFRRDDVLAFAVARVRELLAVSTLGYSERCVPPLETSLPNVFIVNAAQIANGTLNVNEVVGLADAAAVRLRGAFDARAMATSVARGA